MKWQNRQGLWHCFIDQPETGVETSGSAGIAAALAAGARLLPNPPRAVRAARAAHRELLRRHLVAGGFLGGASQANRDGERLQRSGYRVIAHYGAGLLAQLDAHVRSMS
jgi:rhamnogalacturonyl hydrolase YesR